MNEAEKRKKADSIKEHYAHIHYGKIQHLRDFGIKITEEDIKNRMAKYKSNEHNNNQK